jgi:hypothetical protein
MTTLSRTSKPAKAAAKPDAKVLEQVAAIESVAALQALYKGLDETQRTACLEAFAARRKELAHD